ncbi:GLUG domain protein [Limihaloglobus sulfuriphilus]|uniref:GLUG domain protein n=1 Tax=Limihaloglobus sulfuriphilus TaxID=1851148 RepID=A0A1Q2MID4_9BACT|nr:GLUG motif-containing protein [Limihaloglobus sulfuriphilus]AQQ72419.1 GLUG domain protein [Limihaloglobus sulfuriphilus]
MNSSKDFLKRVCTVITILSFFPNPVFGFSGGTGTPENPWHIYNRSDLEAVNNDLTAHYILKNYIDLTSKTYARAVIAPDTSTDQGYQGTEFSGSLDGNSYPITNLKVNGASYCGLFGMIGPDAEINNVRLVSTAVNGTKYAGGLCGYNKGNVSNSYSTGSVNGDFYIGGLAGYNYQGKIERCYSMSTVTGTSYHAGGLVGYNDGIVTNSYAVSMVVGEISVIGNSDVGGMVGLNTGSIETSFSAGGVSGSGNSAGGLVGCNDGNITASYATGAVSLTGAYGTNAGGLAGRNNGGIISNCYSTGPVGGKIFIGGLIGDNSRGSVTNCFSTGDVTGTSFTGGLIGTGMGAANSFWDTQTSNLLISYGGIGLRTQQMKDMHFYSANNWAGGTWTIDQGSDYPHLYWENLPGEAIVDPVVSMEGSGQPLDPWIIESKSDFLSVCSGTFFWKKNYMLNINIDMSGEEYNRALIGYDSLNAFTGSFDGGGHIISNLAISGSGCIGLFGILDAGGQIKSLGLENVSIISTGDITGGLVADCRGIVTNCHFSGVVSGMQFTGGLAGRIERGLVRDCFSSGDIIGSTFAGGLAGYNSGSVTNCYSTGSVSGESSVGGLVGYLDDEDNGSVTCCYSTGHVNGVQQVGGLVGYTENRENVKYGLWDTVTSGTETSSGGVGKTTDQMHEESTFIDAGWDFVGETANGTNDAWTMPSEGGCPVLSTLSGYIPPVLSGEGTQANPYLISSPQELGALYHWGTYAFYRMTDDIDLTGIQWATAVIPFFNGYFDGDGHIIRNMNINGSTYLGLIASLGRGADVSSLGVENASINGIAYIGGLAGVNSGKLSSCFSTGSVQSSGYDTFIGGLAGDNRGDVINCYSTCSVSGQTHTGGLLGENSGYVEKCYSAGPVSGLYYAIRGFIGGYESSQYTATGCFWDIETSGIGNPGDYNYGAIGATTLQMQTIGNFCVAGWDFTEQDGDPADWFMPYKSYPILSWQEFYLGYDSFALLSKYWQQNGCWEPQSCSQADFYMDGVIDILDLIKLSQSWLDKT